MMQGRTATDILLLLMLLLLPAGGRAQEERDSLEVADILEIPASQDFSSPAVLDTLSLNSRVDSLTLRAQELLRKRNDFKPDPKRALWLSLVFPGGGQIYNHKYWKLPIVYGGFLGCYYALSWNNQMLRDSSQA